MSRTASECTKDMPKRKKYPKLPNSYGSIRRLSDKNRTNPYGVYPPVKEFDNKTSNHPAFSYTLASRHRKRLSVIILAFLFPHSPI